MLEPNGAPAAGGADPNAAGGDPNAGADPNAAGGGEQEVALTNKELIDRLNNARGINEAGLNDDQKFRIEQETRNFIDDVSKEFVEEFPDATNIHKQQFLEGMLEVDAGKILRAVTAAVKTTQEKEAMGDGDPKPLTVQGGGAGKGGQEAPKSLNEAVLNIANMFG